MVKNAARSAVHGARAEHEEGRKEDGAKSTCCCRGRRPSSDISERRTDRQTVLLLPPFDGRKTRARRPREGGKSSCWKKDPIDPSENACPPFMKRSPDREMECLLNQTRHNKTRKARSTTGFGLMTTCQNVLLVWFFLSFFGAQICLRISHVKAGRTHADG